MTPTTSAKAAYDAGRLDDAIRAAIEEVKAAPGDMSKRLFLFELAWMAGDLDRARRQLAAVRFDDIRKSAGVETYRRLLDAEEARRNVWRGTGRPEMIDPGSPGLAARFEALEALRAGRLDEVRGLLDRAEAEVEAASRTFRGTWNGAPVAILRDADDLLGDVLEVFIGDKYHWLPLSGIEEARAEPPRSVRDLIVYPVNITHNGRSGEVFVPALYPFTHERPDDELRLGRGAEWVEAAPGVHLGAGLKHLLVDDDLQPLPELRELRRSPE